MRFPWLQVDADFIAAHAGDLGAHLGISRREAMGLALDLWTWALARAPDDAPPDGVVTGAGPVPDRLLSGSVGWTGPVEQFTEALVGCGLAVRIDGGYRLTGFGRYKATWEKNRRRPGAKPDRFRSGTGEDPARKTQTQIEKKEEDLLPAGASAPAAHAKKAKEAKKEPTGDPRHAPLVRALTDAGWPFDGPKDAAQVKALLALADQQEATRGALAGLEVLRRAQIAWSQFPGFHSARTLSGLRSKWGEFAQPESGTAQVLPLQPKKLVEM